MKKIVSIFMVALLCVGFFILPSTAAAKNHKLDFQFATVAPIIDGEVKTNEYGAAIHSIDNSDQFNKEFDPAKRVKATFYATWTKEALYMAWVVDAAQHTPMTPADKNSDGKIDEKDMAHMWPHSCIQFIITPGAPDASKKTYQTGALLGNYLEVGLMLAKDGTSYKAAWALPVNAALTVNDWDFVGGRNEAKKTTTYEVRVPWEKSGIREMGTGSQFGLSYAVADQNNPDGVGSATGAFNDKGMVEWQDAILGSKNADNAGVITLKGGDVEKTSIAPPPVKQLPELPANTVPAGNSQIAIDKVNASLLTGEVVLATKLKDIGAYNFKYTRNLVLEPVAGKANTFKVAQLLSAKGNGNNPDFSALKADSVVLGFHSDSTTDPGHARILAAEKLKVGDEVILAGVDAKKGEATHKTMLLHTAVDLKADGSSESTTTSSVDTTTSSESTTTTSSAPVSSSSSTATSSATSSKASDDTNNWIVWVIVGVVVVAGGAGAAYYFISKKKK